MSIIIITIIIFLCTVNGKGEWSLHDLEVGEVQNLHKISNVGGCQLREKLARGGNWAMFRFMISYISFQKLYTNTGPFRHAYYAVTPSHVESGRFNKNDHAWSSFVFLLQSCPCHVGCMN